MKFTGSSPIEIDYKRQLRAEQWARFCGRHPCAELIEKWSRTRNLDKMPFSNKDQNDGTVIGRARANSTIQTPVNLAPIKTERGIVIQHSTFNFNFGMAFDYASFVALGIFTQLNESQFD